MSIRSERSFEHFSRGNEVVRAIRMMWEKHERIPASVWPKSTIINKNIEDLMGEFDLTVDEWHYWAEITRKLKLA
jgi:hypothetical protein